MKNKSFAFLSLALLTVLILTSFASAAITFGTSPTLSMNGSSATINVTGVATENITFSLSSITENGKTITFGVPTAITNATGSAQTVTITYTVPSDFSFYFGKTYSTTLTAIGTTSGNATQTISFRINDPALNTGYADDGNLDISIDNINVEKGYGEDSQWYPLDQISAKINVDNNGADKIKSIVVKYGLYDLTSGKWIFTDSQSSFSLNDGDSKSLTADFTLDSLSKFKDGDNYKFYAWATGSDEKTDPVTKTSVAVSEDIEMQFDTDLVTLSNIQIPTTINCGQEVQITADVANIGTDDQSDVYIKIINTKLGINKQVQIGDINNLESSPLDFTFTIPSDITEGTYPVELMVYNPDNTPYKSDLNGDDARFQPILTVQGACSTIPLASIAASLQSEAKAGQELDVKATIVNTGSSTATFNIGLSSYADWSSLTSMDKNIVTLAAGASQDVMIKLNVNKDVSGDKTFDIVLTQGDKILNQPVKVTVAQQAFFAGITGMFSGASSNWYLWGIAALNVLLVLIIIVVAVKVARKK
ncbi:Uncharacterised protein [uncultured archaeon]|nr:Uncharacterised protein [uncultured archaeon]